jgi:hypothetical protein
MLTVPAAAVHVGLQAMSLYESTFVGLQALGAHFAKGSPELQAAEDALMGVLSNVVIGLKGVYGDDVLYQVRGRGCWSGPTGFVERLVGRGQSAWCWSRTGARHSLPCAAERQQWGSWRCGSVHPAEGTAAPRAHCARMVVLCPWYSCDPMDLSMEASIPSVSRQRRDPIMKVDLSAWRLLLLLLLNWVRATPDRPFMSSKSLSQTRLIGLYSWPNHTRYVD